MYRFLPSILLLLLLLTACGPVDSAPRPTPTEFGGGISAATPAPSPTAKKSGDAKPTALPSATPSPAPPRQAAERTAYRLLDASALPAACPLSAAGDGSGGINHAPLLQWGMCLAGEFQARAPGADLNQDYYFGGENVTMVFGLEPLADDSIRASEYRIDLAFGTGGWKIAWLGGRWKCQAGRGQADWGSDLCK
jgi:hypothetical protein